MGTAAVTPRQSGWSNGTNRGTGADVHHADATTFFGEVDFLSLDSGTGESASNGSHGGTVCGVDDADGVSFEFSCVCHANIMPPAWFNRKESRLALS